MQEKFISCKVDTKLLGPPLAKGGAFITQVPLSLQNSDNKFHLENAKGYKIEDVIDDAKELVKENLVVECEIKTAVWDREKKTWIVEGDD